MRDDRHETAVNDRRDALQIVAREGLRTASLELASDGVPRIEPRGKLLRPLIALAAVPSTPVSGFWDGVLGVQLAHEASLVHDDIVDEASVRRAVPSAAAELGIPRAVLHGDQLLTAAYRAAARTGSIEFVQLFARAVERTVAGESDHAGATGEKLDWSRYVDIALGKSGELIGCALALAPVLERRTDAMEIFELGRQVGLLYQLLDDLLDYCPSTDTGKAPLVDYEHRRWTWPLAEASQIEFGRPVEEVLEALHGPDRGKSPVERGLGRMDAVADACRKGIAEHLDHDDVLRPLLDDWISLGREAAAREAERRNGDRGDASSSSPVDHSQIEVRVPPPESVRRYLAANSHSFRFALRFLLGADAQRIARVYAYCRVTDDLVDQPPPNSDPAALLGDWLELSRRAYLGRPSGIPLVDVVMGEMASAGVTFDYAADLVEGMRMDVRGQRYGSVADLRGYTYRVASVVGLWICRLFGVHDPAVLDRAERMGHAMQVTNILRDVGEDWRNGRLYLPLDQMNRYGVTEAALSRMCAGGPIPRSYAALVESLIESAEADYDLAIEAVPSLPRGFARPAAVAASVYRGILDDIRDRGYDNVRQRAFTTPTRKGWLSARALWSLARAPAPLALAVRPGSVSTGPPW